MKDEKLQLMAYLLGFNGFNGFKINTPYDSVTFEKNGQECILTKKQFIDIHLPNKKTLNIIMKNKHQSMEDHTPTIVKTNTFYILVCLSLILIGFLLGVSLEDSISIYLKRTTIDFSDVVASIGLTVTAGFAYFGLKEQRQQKIIQAEPYLHSMITIDREKSHYKLELVNSGPGAAIDMVYCFIWEESILDEKFEVIGMLTFRSFMQKATDSSRDFIMQYSTPKALRSSDKANFLEISLEVPDSKKFTRIENVLRRTTLKLSYKTTLGELREKSFGLRK